MRIQRGRAYGASKNTQRTIARAEYEASQVTSETADSDNPALDAFARSVARFHADGIWTTDAIERHNRRQANRDVREMLGHGRRQRRRKGVEII